MKQHKHKRNIVEVGLQHKDKRDNIDNVSDWVNSDNVGREHESQGNV